MKILSKIKSGLIGILIFALLIVLSPLIIPVVVVMQVRSAISLRRFRRREAGSYYLVCTSKRNWYDFLRNNVIPMLPDNVRVVWQKPTRGEPYPELQAHLAQSKIWGISKPYLVAVTKQALRAQSLNRDFQDVKPKEKRSDEIRNACLKRIETSMRELLTTT
ncbi:MAG: hypothetical protein KAH23_04965 [Kiritimatiellae bacterium]|nr:hypothetical protein [Kiritimatiellia bacterium]